MVKKERLSINELLEQALVKDEDKPYNIPINWVWTKLGSVIKLSSGQGLTLSKMNSNGTIPVYGGNGVTGFHDSWNIEDVTIIIGRVGFYCGCVHLITEKAWVTDNALIVSFPQNCLNLNFLYWILTATNLRLHNSSTAQPVISGSKIYNLPIPIPPISEQQRIVDLIVSLFEKLDRAKELVQSALDFIENRKSVILYKAFTGELTAIWRNDNGFDFERDWETRPFKEVASVRSHLVNPDEYKNFPHIAPDNIEKRTGKLLAYNTIEQDGVISGKHRFYSGQILYSKIRPYLSKIVIIDFDGLCSADMYPIETKLNTRYLWYYMLSDDFVMAASSAGSRSVLPKINQKELGELTIVYPSIDEQTEIVRILDELLEKEQRAKELCDVIDNIELMKKSILARAFRGELSTNNPDEESVLELLKEVLKEKI